MTGGAVHSIFGCSTILHDAWLNVRPFPASYSHSGFAETFRYDFLLPSQLFCLLGRMELSVSLLQFRSITASVR